MMSTERRVSSKKEVSMTMIKVVSLHMETKDIMVMIPVSVKKEVSQKHTREDFLMVDMEDMVGMEDMGTEDTDLMDPMAMGDMVDMVMEQQATEGMVDMAMEYQTMENMGVYIMVVVTAIALEVMVLVVEDTAPMISGTARVLMEFMVEGMTIVFTEVDMDTKLDTERDPTKEFEDIVCKIYICYMFFDFLSLML